MYPLLKSLSGGDQRSVGESNRAASAVFENPEWIDVLFQGLETSNAVLCMRCADAIEKVTDKLPALLPLTPAMKARSRKLLNHLR